MREPDIKTEVFGRDRYVTVQFCLAEKSAEYVSVWFLDPESPGETSEAERERLVVKALSLLRKVAKRGRSPPRSGNPKRRNGRTSL